MDEGLEARLGAILSDPQQMEKISSLATQLMGGAGLNKADASVPSVLTDAEGTVSDQRALSGGLGSVMEKLMGGGGKQSKSEALLLAMRPYLRPGRQEKLEKALRVSRMLRLAGTVMKEYGGESSGL